jgi:hypothetical protein
MSRSANMLVFVGLMGSVLGLLAYLTFAMHAALYVPPCQNGLRWSSEAGCQSLVIRVCCSIGCLSASLLLLVAGLAQKARKRWWSGSR